MTGADDRMVDHLRALAQRVDPPPALLGEFARAALGWRTIDAELAELSYDSAVDESLAGAVRGATRAPRLLTFDVGEVTVEVEVTAQGAGRSLAGQVVPMQSTVIEVRHSAGSTTVDTDELGRFAVEGLPAGPMSLRCRLADGGGVRVVQTDWSAI